MNILIFAHDCGLRGAERVAADQAEALTRRGWKVTVVVPCKNGGLMETLQRKRIDVIHVRYSGWVGPGTLRGRVYRIIVNLVAIPRLIRVIRTVQPDLIFVHSIFCGIGAIVARLSSKPRIWLIHEAQSFGTFSKPGSFDLGEPISVKLISWANCRMLAVSSVAAQLSRDRLGIPSVGVLYQSITVCNDWTQADGPALIEMSSWSGPKLVVIGSLLPLKGQLTAVQAMPEILRSLPDAKLFLIGNDPVNMSAELSSVAESLGVADRVTHLGTLTNAAPAIVNADCCLITSIDESFGRVTIEAMLCKTSVIAADVSVNREVAGNNNVDFFTPSSPTSLAAAVTKLLSRSERERSEILTRALTFAREKFNSEAAADALESELLVCLDTTGKKETEIENS